MGDLHSEGDCSAHTKAASASQSYGTFYESIDGASMRSAFLVSLALSIVVLQPLLGAGISLVEKGNSSHVIYLSRHASTVEKFAADELQKYIEQVSGARLPIKISDGPERTPGIYIGQSSARYLDTKITDAYPGLDGFVMKTIGNDIVLAGGEERGTLYAVYELLEAIGCRWYAPGFAFYGDAGSEFVPKLRDIHLPNLDTVEHPSYKFRKKYVEEGWTHIVANLKQMIDWMAKARLNVLSHPIDYQHWGRVKWDNVREALVPELKKRGIMVEVGGHGYPNFLPPERYFKDHPDWFAEIGGKRTSSPHAVFNTSNKDALATFTRNVLKYLGDHPEIDILDLWPPDNARWSEDAQSLAQGSPARRQALILNTVAQAAREKFPRTKIEFIAYQTYLSPPENIEIDSNVVMDFCPIRQTFAYPIFDDRAEQNVPYKEALSKWFQRDAFKGDIGIYSYYRRYVWRSLPVVMPNLVASEMRWYRKLGVTSLSSYSEPGDWFTYELLHYAIARLSWNVDTNIPLLIREYCNNRYRAAGESVARYFQILEQTLPKQNGVAFNTPPTLAQSAVYLRNLDTCASLLKNAEQEARTAGDSSVSILVGKLQLSLEYTRLDLMIGELSMRMGGQYVEGGVERLAELAEMRARLFNSNLDKGIFISRGERYYSSTTKKRGE
jgi:hypothetical protein